VNLPERILEVYREPTGENYSAQLRYTLEESVSSLFEPEWQIPVRALFDG
jgi:Uma2 family endonuclease